MKNTDTIILKWKQNLKFEQCESKLEHSIHNVTTKMKNSVTISLKWK